MADGLVYYETKVGTSAIDVFGPEVKGAVSGGTIGVSEARFGSSGGASFDRMKSSFEGFQKEVDDRLVEQGRVGGVVGSMLEGLHRRVIEADETVAGVFEA